MPHPPLTAPLSPAIKRCWIENPEPVAPSVFIVKQVRFASHTLQPIRQTSFRHPLNVHLTHRDFK